jgi:hypothetical protein
MNTPTHSANPLECPAIPANLAPDWSAQTEPCAQPVNGCELLSRLTLLIRRFVILPQWAPESIALWILHTYAFHLRDVTTYLGIESPEKRCGKTTLLAVLSELVNRPVVAANISPSAFFRVIQETRPTLLIDEADTFLQGNDELRGILNSGYTRKTAFVLRVSAHSRAKFSADSPENLAQTVPSAVPQPSLPASESPEPPLTCQSPEPACRAGALAKAEAPSASLKPHGIHATHPARTSFSPFSTWCPKALACIGKLPDTLADRCILIRMQRKTASEQCERLRDLRTEGLKAQCVRFVQDHAQAIADARPDIPPELNDRAADIWEPLIALADLAGAEWPHLARQAAKALSASAQESNPGSSLLLDILVAFAVSESPRLFSRTLLARLTGKADRPWRELCKGGKPTEQWLAQRLRPYGIRPRSLWIDGIQAKGYEHDDFQETFRRYIPRSDIVAFLTEQRQKPPQIAPDSPPPLSPR